MPSVDPELAAALKAVEASFHVRLIATFGKDLVWAPAHAAAGPWLAANSPDFDQFPVKAGTEAVGLLLRQGAHDGKTVRSAMHPLRDGLIISSDTPLTALIPALRREQCFLVLRRGRIDGLVTQSDLVKLPVRMLLFGLISHLELCLRALVRLRAPEPAWVERLKGKRRRQIEREYSAMKEKRLDPDRLEFTTFSDLLDVLRQVTGLSQTFLTEMEAIRTFRNDIAHSKTYVQTPADASRVVATFASIRKSIRSVSRLVRDTH